MILGHFGFMDDAYERQFGYFTTEARRIRRRWRPTQMSDNHEGHKGHEDEFQDDLLRGLCDFVVGKQHGAS